MQIKRRAKVRMDTQKIKRAAGRAAIKTHKQAGAMIYRIARNSIQRRKNKRLHSPPGKPPYTHSGALKKSIRYAAVKENVVIGPSHSGIGLVAHLHEFGGRPKKKKRRTSFRNNWNCRSVGMGRLKSGQDAG